MRVNLINYAFANNNQRVQAMSHLQTHVMISYVMCSSFLPELERHNVATKISLRELALYQEKAGGLLFTVLTL